MYQSIQIDNEIRQTMVRHLADYKLLIEKVQRHTHCTESCLRRVSGSNRRVCRYGYEKELLSQSRIIRKENGSFDLQMKRNDSRINNHCPATQIRDMIGSLPTSNRNSTSFVQSVLIKQSSLRDYSSQESIWILMSFPFYSSSRQFVVINLKEDAYVFIEDPNNNEENIRDPETVYANRLNYHLSRFATDRNPSESLQNLSLYEFFSNYYVNKNDRTKLSKRRKRPVLRIYPRYEPTNARNELNEQYCKLQIKLHVPWTVNFINDLNPQSQPWSQIYNNYSNLIPNFINIDNIQAEEEEFEEGDEEDIYNLDLEEWMIYQRLLPDRNLSQA